MKIIGFAQLRNELEKGNLENWCRIMSSICDYVYIYDQNSTDNSLSYYSKFDNFNVISSPTNRFGEELICKGELLEKIKVEHPDSDWIFALDGDTLVDGRLLKDNGNVFRALCGDLLNESFGTYLFGHKNLWRSQTYWRYDNLYDAVNTDGVRPLWRFKPDLVFSNKVGLHISAEPANLGSARRLDYTLVHMGFTTDAQIITKYNLYKSHGQTGYLLDRFLDETELAVERIDMELLPEWLEITDDVSPINKKNMRDVYNETKH